MQFSDKALWDDWKSKQSDSYGLGIFEYAERWAGLMEKAVPADKPITHEIMQSTSHEADTDGITGFMYGAAVTTLSKTWTRGEELRILHNADYGVSADKDGVVNPAILTLKD